MKRAIVTIIMMSVGMICAACDREAPNGQAAPDRAAAPAAAASTSPVVAKAGPRVVFLGDSLTAGRGVDADEAFPALIGKQLESEGIAVQIVNAGVSGDTTAGGLRRLDWILKQKPDILVLCLGGNDGLRGMSVDASTENLRTIIRRARDAGARVLLLGMMIPPNYGPEYANAFRDMYPRLAKEFDVPLVPFVLEGVGGDARLNQSDGIHPTVEGHRIIAGNVVGHVRKMVNGS